MTPEQVAEANELLSDLRFYRKQFEQLKRAKQLHIQLLTTKDEETSWVSSLGTELFDEVKNTLFEEVVSDIDATERRLRALGVNLPAPDFIDLPAVEDLQTDPA